jgi:hypothetical protein
MPIVERSEFCDRTTVVTETSQAYSPIPPQMTSHGLNYRINLNYRWCGVCKTPLRLFRKPPAQLFNLTQLNLYRIEDVNLLKAKSTRCKRALQERFALGILAWHSPPWLISPKHGVAWLRLRLI